MPEWDGVFRGAGIYGGLPEDDYHADVVPGGSLSVSGAKKLLDPSCPAIFDYERKHRKPPSKSMELGTVVHGLVLGTGQPVEVLDYHDYKKKEAQAKRDAAIDAGKVPMLTREWDKANEIAAAVKNHDTAGALYAEGDAEQSMFWHDDEFGIWCRGRTDWVTSLGYPVIADLKTAESAGPDKFTRAVYEYGYYMQDPYYRRGLARLLGCEWDEIDFMFVVVQTTAPYLVQIYRVNPADTERGWERCRKAMEIYRDCTSAGIWPAWSDDITELSLPGWARQQIEREMNDWHGLTYDY